MILVYGSVLFISCGKNYYYYFFKYIAVKERMNSKLEKKIPQIFLAKFVASVDDFSLTQCRTIYETNERKN